VGSDAGGATAVKDPCCCVVVVLFACRRASEYGHTPHSSRQGSSVDIWRYGAVCIGG